MTFHSRGRSGEDKVAHYLTGHGYTILARNFILRHGGEIDIIARCGEYLACVEVKTRWSLTVPFASLIPLSKQRKIIKTAHFFIQMKRLHDVVVRFDTAFVDMTCEPARIEYLENAFQVQ